MAYEFTTITQVRRAFWQGNEHLQHHYKRGKRQNDYCTTIRCEFVDFVDMLARERFISESLAQRVTL